MRLVSLPSAQGPLFVNPESVSMLECDGDIVWLHLDGVSDKSWPIYLPVWKIMEMIDVRQIENVDPEASMLEQSARLALRKAAEICEHRAMVTNNEAVRTMARDLAREIMALDPTVAAA
jgi:hypothetical protein